MTRKPAFKTSPSNSAIKEVQTIPERRVDMPYAPAIRVESPCGLLFISGATPSPLYHKHPHVIDEHDHPNRIEDQTRRAMETIKTILDHEGLTWPAVVTGRTAICVNALATQGARVELDMIAAFPKGD